WDALRGILGRADRRYGADESERVDLYHIAVDEAVDHAHGLRLILAPVEDQPAGGDPGVRGAHAADRVSRRERSNVPRAGQYRRGQTLAHHDASPSKVVVRFHGHATSPR